VGQPYDAATVAKDVRMLWSAGRFRDVHVETVENESGTDVIFRVTPEPQYPLHEVRVRPHSFGLQIALAPGTLITQPRANDLALNAMRQLNERGYARAKVTASVQQLHNGKADVFLDVVPGEALRLRAVGDPSLKPPKWYSSAAVENHAARLRSLWATKGYYDVRVTTGEQLFAKEAVVNFRVEPGRFYHPIDTKTICGCLFEERRKSERQGILDFQASLDENGKYTIEKGREYTVGRIRFIGHSHYTDTAIRKHFLLDEGVPMDSWLLRQSVVRLNRSGMFEPLDEHQVHIATNATTGIADVTVNLTERKRGAWSFSGPFPLSGSVSMRLPAWGSGIAELSSYTASLNALAYSTILKAATNRTFAPVFSIDRPFTPGNGWLSGFSISPQLAPQIMVIHYISTQLLERLGPKLAGTRVPDLPVSLERPNGDVPILCEAPKPRMHALRMGAGIALQFVRTLTY
jgi:outer membrane protein insertion porin family